MTQPVVLFDLDGTLLDTIADLRDSLNRILTKNGLFPHTTDEVKQYIGNGISKLVARAIPNGDQHPQFDRIVLQMREDYALHCNDQTSPYPQIHSMLSELRQQNYRIGVVSNKPDAQVKSLCATFFGDFIQVAVGQSESVPINPAPDCVFAALQALGGSTDNCVYIGDSDVDIYTAQNARISCISVSWGFRSRDQLIASGATQIADSPSQIPALLKNTLHFFE